MGSNSEKAQLTEEDIKLRYITPAITAKWSLNQITMETKITDGKINLKGNLVVREKPKKADYVLYLNSNTPIAIVEAKDNNHTVSYGLQQAMTYAQIEALCSCFGKILLLLFLPVQKFRDDCRKRYWHTGVIKQCSAHFENAPSPSC